MLGKMPFGQHGKGNAPRPRVRVAATVAILLAACAVCAGVVAAQMGGIPELETASNSHGSGSQRSAQGQVTPAIGSDAADNAADDAEETAADEDDADDGAGKTSPRTSDNAKKQTAAKSDETEELALADIDPLSFDVVPASDGLSTFV